LSSVSEEVTAKAVVRGMQYFYAAWAATLNPLETTKYIPGAFFIYDLLGCLRKHLRYGLCEEVYNILNAIFEVLRQLATTALNPPVLILILCFVQELEKADMQPRAHLFLSYLAKLSKIVHGAEHPVRTVTYSIL
jgi:hypothetical protein